MAQIANTMSTFNTNMLQNNSLIQLTNKEVSIIGTKTKENEGTLQWILFEENIPKQVTRLQMELKALKEKVHQHNTKETRP